MRVAVIGAGWAGSAAAVETTRLGWQTSLFETARIPGGRARRVGAELGGHSLPLDNGQHILIAAYSETLRLMRDLGVDIDTALHRMPLTLQFPDGSGLKLPALPAPLDALAGILCARGWSWADRLSLLKAAVGWQLKGFRCAAETSVSELCQGVAPGAMAELIEPLCVSALNTPAGRASGQVFLRVLRDAMFAETGGSNLLLPRTDLSALLPDAAVQWLRAQGADVQLGTRVQSIVRAGPDWVVNTDRSAAFDCVILACTAAEAARLVQGAAPSAGQWLAQAQSLQYEALTTVYAHAAGARLSLPMLALRATPAHPAQFVFDRGQLGGPDGLLAFVVSASEGDHATLTAQVLDQGRVQLGLDALAPVQTIVEKRATFACTPGLERPAQAIAPGLWACGDYVDGPYPATLEGAVRSGLQAARHLH